MRWLLLLVVLTVVLTACSPSKTGGGLLEKSGFDSQATGRAVDSAFDNVKACNDDPQCGVGRICVNKTCQPKPVQP